MIMLYNYVLKLNTINDNQQMFYNEIKANLGRILIRWSEKNIRSNLKGLFHN